MKVQNLVLGVVAAAAVQAAAAGDVQTVDFDGFKLHVYNSGDVMADTSYIVEGSDELVTLEEPLFKANVQEFDAYVQELGKPVAAHLTDYHLGGSGADPRLAPEGMGQFMAEGVYAAMMQGFKQSFGDAMADMSDTDFEILPFNEPQPLAGVEFVLSHGADTDFPGASILIGGQVLLTHWTPVQMHANVLQISSRQAVEEELKQAQAAQESGAVLFIGSHGGMASPADLQFKIGYLHTMQRLLEHCSTAAAFSGALQEAYPQLPGAEGVDALAAALYK